MPRAEAPGLILSGQDEAFPAEVTRPGRAYRDFANGVQIGLQKEWDYEGAQSSIGRAAVAFEWIKTHHEGSLLMPDGETLVGAPGNRDAIRSAMLLDMMTDVVCGYLIRTYSPNHRGNLGWAWTMRIDAIRQFQSRLDGFLEVSDYQPETPQTANLFNDLIGIVQKANTITDLGKSRPAEETMDDYRGIIIGLVGEHKLLKELHSLKYDGAFLTKPGQDMHGMDIGIPYMDPRYHMALVKYLQAKSIGADIRLRAEYIDESGALRIRVPSMVNDDVFSFGESNRPILAKIMDGFVPVDMTLSRIGDLE